MSSPQSNKWLSYFDEPLLDEVGVGQPANPFFWCGPGINDQPDVRYFTNPSIRLSVFLT
jgi:hypothetical protein